MKKLLIVFLLLTWPCILTADLNPYVAGGGTPTAESCAGGSDGTLGSANTSYGGFVLSDYDLVYSEFTADSADDGSITYIHVQIRNNDGGTCEAGIWSLSGTTATLLNDTSTVSGSNGNPQTINLAIPSTCIVDGTTYLLGVSCDDTDTSWSGFCGAYDAAASVMHHSGMEPGGLGNFSTSGDTEVQSSRPLSIVVNNSSSSPF